MARSAGADGVIGREAEPHSSLGEAAAHAGAFLALHTAPDHDGCDDEAPEGDLAEGGSDEDAFADEISSDERDQLLPLGARSWGDLA
jgi:hypothetical protein